ncbi:MAG TPA: type II secretion system protein [Candidatus Ozemobacteraceae bacterium]|nr:type II secretion system protein [Candidatus Ozemobacteraceae bacterium]
MKNRVGFTLIELMIVIAILGIACESFFTPMRTLIADMKSNGIQIQRQDAMTTAFQLMEKAFGESSGLIVRGENEIELIGGTCRLVKREAGGKILVLEKAGAVVRIDLLEGIMFGPFQAVDGKTAWCRAQTAEARFPMFWRCGK